MHEPWEANFRRKINQIKKKQGWENGVDRLKIALVQFIFWIHRSIEKVPHIGV